jgi:voltage-gated potassium channel
MQQSLNAFKMKRFVHLFQPGSVNKRELNPTQRKFYEIIFEARTFSGRLFDLILLATIVMSVIVIMLESVQSLKQEYGATLTTLEWIFTGFFTLEYLLRIYCVGSPKKYIFSFFGIVDLLAIIPTYLTLFFAIGPGLNTIRILRFIRIYNVLRLGEFTDSGNIILTALYQSRHKIIVFLTALLTLVIFIGGLVYFVESTNPESQFTSIPAAIYWAIVTVTTVGYGDITPITTLGQLLSSLLMISGYAIIAVPTGIVTGELVKSNLSGGKKNLKSNIHCPSCGFDSLDSHARYCSRCGNKIANKEDKE